MDNNDLKYRLRNNVLADAFKPKEYVLSIRDIDLDRLNFRGIKALIIDLDDTLIPRRDIAIPISTYSWIEKAKETFKIYLASNGARLPRVKHILNELNIEGNALSFKPLPFAFTHASSVLKTDPAEIAVIGDQLITDILGGNIMGMYTILVRPLTAENAPFRIPLRAAEEILMKLLDIKISS